MAPSKNAQALPYAKDEKVLCFHGDLMYEAKIIEIRQGASGSGGNAKDGKSANGDRHRAVAKTACRWPTRRRVLPRLNSKSSQRLSRTSRTRNTPSGTTPRLGEVRRSMSPLVVNCSVPSISLVVLWCSYTRPAMRITHFSLHCPEYLVVLQFCDWWCFRRNFHTIMWIEGIS